MRSLYLTKGKSERSRNQLSQQAPTTGLEHGQVFEAPDGDCVSDTGRDVCYYEWMMQLKGLEKGGIEFHLVARQESSWHLHRMGLLAVLADTLVT